MKGPDMEKGKKIKQILYTKSPVIEETPCGKTRVAAYCRVSTKSEKQQISYETQVAVYKAKIANESDWAFAGIYADWGLTGTLAKGRPGFQKMMMACEEGKIDLILCKSLSRFSRNTMEALDYIRRLKELGVRIIFEKEGIDTGKELSEMLITVLAAFAQEESRNLSENVKWGKRKRMQDGQCALYPPYGYQKTSDGKMEPHPEEAETVKRIFAWYEHGALVSEIIKALKEKGIAPPDQYLSGADTWEKTRIWYILQNEKYIGDLKTQKSYRLDHITHKKVKNTEGVLPQHYYYNHHTPIISRNQFERCNRIFQMRSRKPYQRYPFGDYLRCPYCGHVLTAHKLGTRFNDRHFCCEGEGACRRFVILVKPVEQAILDAYERVPLEDLLQIAENGTDRNASCARAFFKIKNQYPSFQRIDYWWLDELVEKITFGRHRYLPSQLEELEPERRKRYDDRTIEITWRCGLVSTMPSGVLTDSQDPRSRARIWDDYIRKYPDRCPYQAEEVLRKERSE